MIHKKAKQTNKQTNETGYTGRACGLGWAYRHLTSAAWTLHTPLLQAHLTFSTANSIPPPTHDWVHQVFQGANPRVDAMLHPGLLLLVGPQLLGGSESIQGQQPLGKPVLNQLDQVFPAGSMWFSTGYTT